MLPRIPELLRSRWVKDHSSYVYAMLGEATLAITFVFHIVLARVLGPDRFGLFAAAAALTGILAVLIQFGFPVLLHRSVAADHVQGGRHTLLYLFMESLHVLPLLLVLPPLLSLLGFHGEGVAVCYLMLLAEYGRGAKMVLRSVMKGRGWFKTESIAVTIERLLVALLAGFVLIRTQNLVAVVATLALARLVDNAGVAVFLYRKRAIGKRIEPAAMPGIYRKVYPFALHGVLWILYYQVDVVMLKALATPDEVGFYGAAYRLVEIFAALTRVVFFVAFTHFSRTYARNPAQLPRSIFTEARVLMLLVLPGLVLAGCLQAWMVRVLFGTAYLPSVLLLAILLPSLGIKMFSTLSEEYLLATGRERKLPLLLLAVAGVNVAANSMLIPRFGATGAAWATLLSEALFCTLGMRLLIRYGGGRVGRRLFALVIPCTGLCAAPSLVHFGLAPLVAWALAIPCALALVLGMRAGTLNLPPANPPSQAA